MQMYNEYHPYLCWLAQLEGIGRKGIFALLQAAGENSLLPSICPAEERTGLSAAFEAGKSENSTAPAGPESARLEPSDPGPAYPESADAADLMAAARTLYTAPEKQINYLCGEAFSTVYRSRQAKNLLLESRRKGREPGRIAEELEKAGIRFSCILEQGFPEKLRQIPDPPFGIYYRGGLPENGDLQPP